MALIAAGQITLSAVVDVAKTTKYYNLQSSTLAKPARPTANPPSGWVSTEPTYTAGATNSLYTCDLTSFSDSTWSYSDVSLSSSYEAAKDAYNKAIAAAKTATDYMDFGADGLVVGDMASGALAGNVSIKSDGVELRYGSSVLARLKAGVLELAANSVNAVVKLCGGKGTIAYYAATNELAIMSPGQTVLTTCMTLPDGTVQSSDVGVACRRDSVLIKGAVEMHGGLTVDYAPVYGGKILFYNPSQSMAGTIELSETAEGYNYFDLLCKTDQSHYFSVKVPDPNNKMAVLSANVFDGNNAAVVKSKVVHITGKIINTATWWPGKYATGQSYIWANSTCGSDYGDFVTVVCVVGYK